MDPKSPDDGPLIVLQMDRMLNKKKFKNMKGNFLAIIFSPVHF